MADWKEKAYTFARTSDRGSPPYFVGRQDVFTEIEGVVEDLSDRYDCGPTIALTGAQGSGKTAFLQKLKTRQWQGRERLLTVEIEPDDLSYQGVRDGVALSVLDTLPEEKKNAVIKGGFSLGFANVAVESTPKKAKTEELQRGGEFFNSLSQLTDVATELKDAIVLLLVDEAQTIDFRKETAKNVALTLHKGNDRCSLRILPFYAGLATLPENLDDAGLSRLAQNKSIALSPLSSHEGKSCVIKTLGSFCNKVPDSFAKWLAAESDGWPQHLNSSLRAVATRMVEENTNEIAKLDVDQLKNEICRQRNIFYELRARRVNDGAMREVTEAILKEIGSDGLKRTDVINLIQIHMDSNSNLESEIKNVIPRSTQSDENLEYRLFRSLMGSGILDYSYPGGTSRKIVKCPIPSMQNWFENDTHQIRTPFPVLGIGY